MAVLQATDVRHLAGVPAATHTPLLGAESRSTLLDGGWHREVTRCARRVSRKDIDLADHIAVSAETTLPTGIDPAAWFVPMPAVRAGLTGVVLILKHHSDAFSLGFVLDIGPDFAVAPSTDFLIALLR